MFVLPKLSMEPEHPSFRPLTHDENYMNYETRAVFSCHLKPVEGLMTTLLPNILKSYAHAEVHARPG